MRGLKRDKYWKVIIANNNNPLLDANFNWNAMKLIVITITPNRGENVWNQYIIVTSNFAPADAEWCRYGASWDFGCKHEFMIWASGLGIHKKELCKFAKRWTHLKCDSSIEFDLHSQSLFWKCAGFEFCFGFPITIHQNCVNYPGGESSQPEINN